MLLETLYRFLLSFIELRYFSKKGGGGLIGMISGAGGSGLSDGSSV